MKFEDSNVVNCAKLILNSRHNFATEPGVVTMSKITYSVNTCECYSISGRFLYNQTKSSLIFFAYYNPKSDLKVFQEGHAPSFVYGGMRKIRFKV